MKFLPKSLFVRLALAGGIGSLISVLALGSYIAYEQGELATRAAHKESNLLTSELATTLATYLIVKNYAEIEQAISQFTTYPNLDNLLVINNRGDIIVEAKRNQENGHWNFIHSGVVEPPQKDSTLLYMDSRKITSWMPIAPSTKTIGWIRTSLTLEHIYTTQHQILGETFFIVLLSIAISTGAVVFTLRKPIRQIVRATEFAANLPKNYGNRLVEVSSALEVQKLISVLNQTSEILQHQEQELRQINDDLILTLQAIPDWLFELDNDGKFVNVWANDKNLLAKQKKMLIGRTFKEVLPSEAVNTLMSALRDAQKNSFSSGQVIQLTLPNHSNIWFELSISYKSTPDSTKDRFVMLSRDVTDRILSEQQLRIAATVFNSQEGMIVTDMNNIILKVNSAFTDITGYSEEDVIGKNPHILQSGRQDTHFYKVMWESIFQTGSWKGEIWNRRKNGEIYPEHITITAVKNMDGVITNFVSTMTDITINKAAADEIERLAFYDPLTGLPNRRLLLDRLQSALISSHRNRQMGGLLFIDMDNFKSLNDTLGHDIGDLLLKQVAQRLELCLRESDTVARLGGDEFIVILDSLSEQALESATQIEVIGNKIIETLNQPYILVNYNYHCTPSIGATLFYGHDYSIDELLKQADIAMYQAKSAGRNNLCFFDPQMQATISARMALEADLRVALKENQFELYFQPQVYNEKLIKSAEVLIRWHHPTRGIVAPADFIPLAEETGLIVPIGLWVIKAACDQIKSWNQHQQAMSLQLSINVSPRQFHQTDFVEQVTQIIDFYEIDPSQIKLEITESLVIDNIDDTISKMNALGEIGVGFSMDDFGIGYSSLSSLRKLPLDQLKIDQSFVREILTGLDDAVMVQTIIAMAKNLRMEVVAEGVETTTQRDLLKHLGCSICQGYLFSKPLPLEEFEDYIKQNNRLI